MIRTFTKMCGIGFLIFWFLGAKFPWHVRYSMHISLSITGMTLLCHCQGPSHKITGSNSSKNEMSGVTFRNLKISSWETANVLIIKSILPLEVSLLDDIFGEFLLTNKPETGLNFPYLLGTCCPWNAMLKHFFPLQLCVYLSYKVYTMLCVYLVSRN